MKYLKRFEWERHDLEIGDYVICEEEGLHISNFIKSHIGKLIHIELNNINDITYYFIQYENIPDVLKPHFTYNNYTDVRPMLNIEIKEYGKTPEEVKLKMDANKYNL